jgi:hypothetical protein
MADAAGRLFAAWAAVGATFIDILLVQSRCVAARAAGADNGSIGSGDHRLKGAA